MRLVEATFGQEYEEPELLACPNGRAAAISCQGFEADEQRDAICVEQIGEQMVVSIGDGVSDGRFPNSQKIASQFVLDAVRSAHSQSEKKPICPVQINKEAAIKALERVSDEDGKVQRGATVGTSILIHPSGRIRIHRFGDPEFGRFGWTPAPVLTLAPHEHLLPQNGALRKYRERGGQIKTVLCPQTKEDRALTHVIHNVLDTDLLISEELAELKLTPGEWIIAGSDGILLYPAYKSYEEYLARSVQGITPVDLARFAERIALTGHDNYTGFFYRHG